MKITLEYVMLDWVGLDEDNFEIGLKFTLHVEYEYTMPSKDEGFGVENIVFTNTAIDSVYSPQLMLEVRDNRGLKQAVADYLNEHWDDVQDVLQHQMIDPEIA